MWSSVAPFLDLVHVSVSIYLALLPTQWASLRLYQPLVSHQHLTARQKASMLADRQKSERALSDYELCNEVFDML